MGRRSASAPRAGSCRRRSSREACRRTPYLPFTCLCRPGLPGASNTLIQALSPAPQDFVDQTVLQRLVRREEIVTVGVALELVDRLAGMLGKQTIESLAQRKYVFGVDRDVGCLALEAA